MWNESNYLPYREVVRMTKHKPAEKKKPFLLRANNNNNKMSSNNNPKYKQSPHEYSEPADLLCAEAVKSIGEFMFLTFSFSFTLFLRSLLWYCFHFVWFVGCCCGWPLPFHPALALNVCVRARALRFRANFIRLAYWLKTSFVVVSCVVLWLWHIVKGHNRTAHR